jgi:hypothetical protein
VFADWAGLGGDGTGVDVTAVEANPLCVLVAFEEGGLFEQFCEAIESFGVGGFDFGDTFEDIGDVGEALFCCGFGEFDVRVRSFFCFVVNGGGEELNGVVLDIDGESGAIEHDIVAVFGLEEVIEDFGVLFFLICGEGKDIIEKPISGGFAFCGGEVIAIPCL